MFSWWYGAGWRQRAMTVRERLLATMDYFSIDILLRTYFSPFRQISAGRVEGPLGVKLQAFFDKLISRIIGATVRTFIMLIGVVCIAFQTISGGFILATWVIVPLFPVIGVFLFAIEWVPSWT